MFTLYGQRKGPFDIKSVYGLPQKHIDLRVRGQCLSETGLKVTNEKIKPLLGVKPRDGVFAAVLSICYVVVAFLKKSLKQIHALGGNYVELLMEGESLHGFKD